MRAVEKKIAKQAFAGFVIAVVGVIGYIQVFTKGVDRLPEKICSGSVSRDTAARVLPGTMTAHERGRRVDGIGAGFAFSCNVKTRSQDSILSGDGSIHDIFADEWLQGVEGDADASKLSVEFSDIRAVSYAAQSFLYVPCTPAGKKPGEARNAYGLIVEARTIGDTAVTGDELRQQVTDFAFELLKYNYEIQGCQEGLALPPELPRFD